MKIFSIIGPTASGKTKISIQLAKVLNAEIISVDSVMLYKEFNIGSAKPSIKEMQGIKHHLISILSKNSQYTAKKFFTDSKKLIKKIHQRNKNVIFVGGSMMYFKILYDGLSNLPKSTRIRNEIKMKSLNYWYKFLLDKDIESAKKIHKNDKNRIHRFVEIMLITEDKYSNVIKKNKKIGGIKNKIITCILKPSDKVHFNNIISTRFYQILHNGFLQEVKNLDIENDKQNICHTINSVGYKQAKHYLLGYCSYKEFIKNSIISTQQLAKKQITWIKNNFDYDKVKIIDANLHSYYKFTKILNYFLNK